MQQTDAVEFFYGGVAIKRKPAPPRSGVIAMHRPLVERANHPTMWSNYSLLLLNNGGDPLEAVDACRNALALDPNEPARHFQLSIALERAGDLEGAITACRIAVRLHPSFEMFGHRLVQLEHKAGLPLAEAAMEGA